MLQHYSMVRELRKLPQSALYDIATEALAFDHPDADELFEQLVHHTGLTDKLDILALSEVVKDRAEALYLDSVSLDTRRGEVPDARSA